MLEVNGETFEKEVLQADKPVVVDFWGPRCSHCLVLMPHVEALEKKYEEKMKVIKIDASRNRRLCVNLGVIGLPTFVLYRSGKELARLTGNDLTISEIEESLKKVIP